MFKFAVAFAQNPENAPRFFGGFAEYVYANIKNLVRIPKDVDYRAVAIFPYSSPIIIHGKEITT